MRRAPPSSSRTGASPGRKAGPVSMPCVRRCAGSAARSASSSPTALALVFSELLQNALEHGAGAVRIELARRNGDVVLAIADEGAGVDGAASGTGLSIVRALVRDELQGSFDLRRDGGTRAEVVFPA